MISNNDKGNRYHDEKGRFCRATDNKIPYLNDEATKSSGYAKNERMSGKSWEELKPSERNDFIEVNFTTPVTMKLFKEKIIENTIISDIWEPADYNNALDKEGVDVVGETEHGRQYAIDFKCIATKLGQEVDLKNTEHNLVLFKFDGRKGKETTGWLFKDNLTDFVGFTAINTPYTREQLFGMEDRSKLRNVDGASLTFVSKFNLRNYIETNFKSENELREMYEYYKDYLSYLNLPAEKIKLKGKDGTELNLVISKDKYNGTDGYVATIFINNEILRKKCDAKLFIRHNRHGKK